MIKIFESEVVSVEKANDSVRILKLSVPKDFGFKPGQYVSLSVFIGGKKFRKPFSIAFPSAKKGEIELCVKLVENSKTSEFVSKLKKGDKVELFGPAGKFLIGEHSMKKDLVFISVGTGITPFVSMIPSLLEGKFKNKIILLKGFRYDENILYDQLFNKLKIKCKNFEFHNILSRPNNSKFGDKGHVQDFLEKYLPKDFKGDAYICGLSPMIIAVKKKLISMEVPEKNIFYEKYD